MREREIKLAAPPGFRMPAFEMDEVIDGLTPLPRLEERYRTIYMDTPDLRLARWGASLRHRSEEGWTLKLPGRVRDGVLERDEFLFKGAAGAVPAEALDLARAYVRTAKLDAVARLQTVRRGVLLADDQGSTVVDVVDDEVSVFEGRRIASRFREVELEFVPGAERDLVSTLRERFRASGAGDPDPTPKVVRALGAAAVRPSEVQVSDVGSNSTAGEVIGAAIAASVLRLIQHDAVMRLDSDVEGVHQARIATRRLRSILRSFAPLFEPGSVTALREELQWLGAVLGEARDADVRLERLGADAEWLPPDDAEGAAWLLTRLRDQRKVSHDRVMSVVRGERYAGVLDDLVAAASQPTFTELASQPAASLGAMVRHDWEGLRSRVRSSGREPTDPQLHRARIHAKRLRYAAEAVTPGIGKRAAALASAAEALQGALGTLHDAVVAGAWLRDAAREAENPGSVFVCGELASIQLRVAAKARAGWRRPWKRLSGKSLRSWM